MAEVFASRETTLELLDPITGSTLVTATLLDDVSTTRRPVTVDRDFSRSALGGGRRLRNRGTISIRRSPDTMALVREIERWEKGVTYFPLTSDLKGKTYRHPNLRLSLTNADGTVERATAYGVRLSDYGLGRPQGGLVSESITLEVRHGWDLTATEAADQGEPGTLLAFARTGLATYTSSGNAIASAADSTARIGMALGAYSASTSGLVLEPSATNTVLQSRDLSASPWYSEGTNAALATGPGGANTATLLTDSGTSSHRRRQDSIVGTAQGVWLMSFKAGTAASSEVNIYDGASALRGVLIVAWSGGVPTFTVTNGTKLASGGDTATGFYWAAFRMSAAGASGRICIIYPDRANAGGNVTVADVQYIDQGYPVSKIPTTSAAVAKYADTVGILAPHNWLTYSHDLTQTTVSGATVSSANLVTISNTADYVTKYITTIPTVAGVTRTMAIRLRSGTITGTFRLQVNNQSGMLIGYTTITASELSSSARTYYLTFTAPAGTTSLQVQMTSFSATGNFTADCWGLVDGSIPYIVQTSDTAIPNPAITDAGWQQNGKVSGTIVIPSGANVAAGTVVLGGGLTLTHYASTITLSKAANGGTRSVTITKNAADNAAHTFAISWTNYVTSGGTRAMVLSLTVDSTTGTLDTASANGDTSWSTLDLTALLQGACTISGIKFESVSPPAGATLA